MDCPRCGAALSAYRLSEREASVCETCGYVGVATEHGGEPREVESWDAAIRRARRRLIDGADGDAGGSEGDDPDDAGDSNGDGNGGDAGSDGRDGDGSDTVRENGAESED